VWGEQGVQEGIGGCGGLGEGVDKFVEGGGGRVIAGQMRGRKAEEWGGAGVEMEGRRRGRVEREGGVEEGKREQKKVEGEEDLTLKGGRWWWGGGEGREKGGRSTGVGGSKSPDRDKWTGGGGEGREGGSAM